MCESVFVLIETDETNKIFYVEEQTFALGSEEARKATMEYLQLIKTAAENGFQIKQKEKKLGGR